MIRKAKAVWRGTGRDGGGTVSTDSGVLTGTPYSFRARFEDEKGTNPEELIAAAHAAKGAGGASPKVPISPSAASKSRSFAGPLTTNGEARASRPRVVSGRRSDASAHLTYALRCRPSQRPIWALPANAPRPDDSRRYRPGGICSDPARP